MAEDYIIAGQSFAALTNGSTQTNLSRTKQGHAADDDNTASTSNPNQRRHPDHGYPVIVDSGYSTNILPPSLIKVLYGAFAAPPQLVEIQGAALYAAPCDAKEVPSFGVQVGGHVFEQQVVLLAAGANATTVINGTSYCALGAQPGIEKAGAMGVPFLSGVVAVFDIGASEMRFAERAGAPLDDDGPADGGNGTTGTGTTAGNKTSGGVPTGGIPVPVPMPSASSGPAAANNTNAGGRLLPLWGFTF
jgi:hypothetical protein